MDTRPGSAYRGTVTCMRMYATRPPDWGAGSARDADGGRISIAGCIAAMQPGMSYAICGAWASHPRYGDQVQVSLCVPAMPTSPSALAQYLRGTVPGVGPTIALRIADAMPPGEDPVGWLTSRPEIPGVSSEIVSACADAITASSASAQAEIAVWQIIDGLDGVGVGTLRAIMRHLGRSAAAKIRENPYVLMQVARIGWVVADRVARERCSIAVDAPYRLEAACREVMRQAAAEGHAGLPLRSATQRVADLCAVPGHQTPHVDVLELGLEHDMGLVYLHENRAAEVAVSAWVAEMASRQRVHRALPDLSGLDQSQADAVRMISGAPLACLVGGPGTGKTTTLRCIADAEDASGGRVCLIAPTGKAARRMSEQTGRPAQTIHSAIGYMGDDSSPSEWLAGEQLASATLIIIDESSMVDTVLMSWLVSRLSQSQRVLLVGDMGQLRPVGWGAVLQDIVAADVVPVARLTTVHRQATGRLLDLIHAVGRADIATIDRIVSASASAPGSDVLAVRAESTSDILSHIERAIDPIPESDWQIVAPTNVRGDLGCRPVNQRMQSLLRDGTGEFRLYDRVVQTANRKRMAVDQSEAIALVNGQQGTITHVSDTELHVDFDGCEVEVPLKQTDDSDGPDVQLAYCITVHKSQGSEWPTVILPLHRSMPSMMMTREWIYTAISRARSHLIIIGDPRMIAAAAMRPGPLRNSRMVARIRASYAAPAPAVGDESSAESGDESSADDMERRIAHMAREIREARASLDHPLFEGAYESSPETCARLTLGMLGDSQ